MGIPVALQMTACSPVAAADQIVDDTRHSRRQTLRRAQLPSGRQRAATCRP